MGKQYRALVLGFLFLYSVILPNFPFQKEAQAVEVAYTVPFSPWITIKNLVWTGLGNGDTGKAFVGLGGWDTATVQVTGTFAGATCTIEASNDIGTPTWYTAKDITTAGVYVINAGYYQVRPKISAGAGATLTITLVATESTPDTKNLDDLLDVVISNPLNLHIPQYNSTTSKFENSLCSCPGGTVGGSNTHVQFNNNSTFGGDAGFTYNSTTDIATLVGLNLTGSFDISNTNPIVTLTDTTALAKSLKIDVDADIAQIREKNGSPNSLITLNLNNGRFGFKSSAANHEVDFHTASFALRNTLGDLSIVWESSAHAQIHLSSPAGFLGVLNFSDKWRIGRYWDENFSILHTPTSTYSFFISNVTRNIGIGGITTPTAKIHLPAGTATANTAPLKFTTGTNLTTPEIGAVEFVDNGTAGNLYMTTNVAAVATRREVLLATGWTSYTPVVTSETGGWTNYTATGYYRVVDKILTVSFRVVFSAASAVVDAMYISLPAGMTMNTAVMAGGAGWDATHVGCAVLGDSGTISGVPGQVTTRTSTTVLVKYYNAAAASYLTAPGLTNTAPWTWAASDDVVGEFTVPIL